MLFSLRCLRITHLYETARSMRSLASLLGDVFYLQSYIIQNLLSWLLAAFKFILGVHYMACVWIGIQNLNDNMDFFTYPDNMGYIYVDAFYFMTTTISTVGYGDFKAYDADSTNWLLGFYNMLYMCFAITSGILLFTLVTNQVFDYQKLKTIDEIVL